MAHHGQNNDSPQHQALMQLARAETVQEAEQLLSEMCLNQPTRISTLDAMIQQIQQNGIHPSSACCSAIITAFVDAGLLDRAKAYLQYIKAQHKDLPLRTYNVLIDAFGKAQDFQTMEELYELLLAEGITPNVITYNTMLFAFGKAGRFAKMDSFFNQMLQDHAAKANGQEPCVTRDVTTFITLMDAHGRAGHIEQMEIYHRAMLAAGHKPSLKVYNALLSAYGKAQDIEQMTYYVNKMEANGIPPNTGSYNILIGVFGKMGKIDVMEQFYTALRQSGLSPDVFTYNSMLAAYGKALNEEKIQEIWQEMLGCGVQPNVATYQNAIEAYSRLGHISMMEAMYHEAMRKGMQLGVWAYSSLLAAYCNAGDTHKVEVTFESMTVHKVHPNVRCFSSVIKAHAKAGDVETMEKRFRQLMASPGNRPDLEIFITVIKGYGPKYADRAINVFLAMKPSRVMPTVAACHAILEVCAELEDVKELRRLWAHIPQFCKDSQCCKMYSDIMARLGETDVLGLITKEEGGKPLAGDLAAPGPGGPKGGKHKRHSKGGRYPPAQSQQMEDDLDMDLTPQPTEYPQFQQPQQQQQQQTQLSQLDSSQSPGGRFQPQNKRQPQRRQTHSDTMDGSFMSLALAQSSSADDLSERQPQLGTQYGPQSASLQFQDQMPFTLATQSQPQLLHSQHQQHQLQQQQQQQSSPQMPPFLHQFSTQMPQMPGLKPQQSTGMSLQQPSFAAQFDLDQSMVDQGAQGMQSPHWRNRQRAQSQQQGLAGPLSMGLSAMEGMDMPWQPQPQALPQDQYWAPQKPASQVPIQGQRQSFDLSQGQQLQQLQQHQPQQQLSQPQQHQSQQFQQRKGSKSQPSSITAQQPQPQQFFSEMVGLGQTQLPRQPSLSFAPSGPSLMPLELMQQQQQQQHQQQQHQQQASQQPRPWWEPAPEQTPQSQYQVGPQPHQFQLYGQQMQPPSPHQAMGPPSGPQQQQGQLQQQMRSPIQLDPQYLPQLDINSSVPQAFLPQLNHQPSPYSGGGGGGGHANVTKDPNQLLQPNLSQTGPPFYYPQAEGGAGAVPAGGGGYLGQSHGALPLFGMNSGPNYSETDPSSQYMGPPAYAVPINKQQGPNVSGPS